MGAVGDRDRRCVDLGGSVILTFDTETHLIAPGIPWPRVVCVSCTDGDRAWLEYPAEGARLVLSMMEDPAGIVVGHNVFFDLWSLAVRAHQEGFGDRFVAAVFDAAARGKIRDTEIREKLGDIARDRYRFQTLADGTSTKRSYTLADVARRRTRRSLDKDSWRLRYRELEGIPFEQWPQGAKDYAVIDAQTTREVYVSQAQEEGISIADPIPDECNQICRRLFQSLMTGYGLRTSRDAVQALGTYVEAALAEYLDHLAPWGLVEAPRQKRSGAWTQAKRSTKSAAQRMIDACAEKGIPVPRTPPSTKFPQGQVKIDEDSCVATDDPILHDFAAYSKLANVKSKDLKMFEDGLDLPIHSRFDIADTGRSTSAGPNVQNLKGSVMFRCGCSWIDGMDPKACPTCLGKEKISLIGDHEIRACFVPREGYLYAQADYPMLELHTLAEVCYALFGFSHLGDTINSGRDVHLGLARLILPGNRSYEDVYAAFKQGDPQVKAARNLAKVGNFGLPGGLGNVSLVAWAASTGFEISPARAAELRAIYMKSWPEMALYFAEMKRRAPHGGNGGSFTHLYTGRRRFNVRYTNLCNAWFQGLGADASGWAGYLISRACYVDKGSPLYGSRIVNYVHDEFILESPRDRAAEAAEELARIMRDGANVFLPRCPFVEVEPVLMEAWSKDAKTVRDEKGRLIPWKKALPVRDH